MSDRIDTTQPAPESIDRVISKSLSVTGTSQRGATTSTVCYGQLLKLADYPGVRFVFASYPVSDWECPAVLVDEDILDSQYVLEAVVAFGRTMRLTGVMRKAHRDWERHVLPQRLAEVERMQGIDAEKGHRETDVLVAAAASNE